MKEIKKKIFGKKWTLWEKLQLYRLVNLQGNNWSEFSKIFGVTPNAVFNKYRYTNWDSLFDKNFLTEDKVLADDSLDELTSISESLEESIEKENDVMAEVGENFKNRKEKILTSHELRKQNELLNKLATEQIIIDKIIESISSLPAIDIKKICVPKYATTTRPQEATLLFSDPHIGLAVNPEEIGDLSSSYNTEVFTKRMNSLVNKIVKITDHHRKSSTIDNLNIFCLGDIVHGSNDAGKWGFLNTEINVMDQVFLAVNEITKALLTLSKVFKKVKFYGIYGNHGRVGKKGVEKRYVNWDYLIYKYIEKSLENQKNIVFEIPKAPFLVANVMGNKFLLLHGEEIKGWAGIPFYGIVRSESKYRNLFDRSKKLPDLINKADKNRIEGTEELLEYAYDYTKSFDYMVLAHFHQMAELESASGGKIIVNSSFVGGDDYSVNSLLSASTAAQKFFGVHAEGKSFSYDLELDRE